MAALIEPLSVAAHDVRLSGLTSDETAVVIGGGPIGLLVAMVAKAQGAQNYFKVNKNRIAKAQSLGFDAVSPIDTNLVDYVKGKAIGDLPMLFEVAGVQPALDVMTEVAGIRGRIVMVAIHGEKKPVDLFKFFWKELKLISQVYERRLRLCYRFSH